jgi:methylmalonyl-CoA/ethylmalonyl-CoA epimerase
VEQAKLPDPAADIASALGLGAIDQVAFVVRDMADAVSRYAPLFGAFKVFPASPTAVYRGETSRPRLLIGVARSGSVQIELIELVEGDTPHRDHLDRHGEGLHHVRFRVDDLDGTQAAMEANGYTTVWSGGQDNVRFAYLRAPGPGEVLVELLHVA